MTEDVNQTKTSQSTGNPIVGIFLLLPALFCCFTGLFLPTLRTFWLSLQDVDMFVDKGQFVGLENYAHLLGGREVGPIAGFTLLSLVVRLLVVAVVPPLLAWAVVSFGCQGRRAVRIVSSWLVVMFVPVAIAVVWSLALRPGTGLLSFDGSVLGDPTRARVALLLVDALYTFGLACGLGAIFYLPIWRSPDGDAPSTFSEKLRPFLAVWGIGILATIALSLSSFTLNFVMTGGGPMNRTKNLGLWMYEMAFNRFSFGPGAALGSVILGVAIVAGIVAGLLVVLTRLRLDVLDREPSAEPAEDASGASLGSPMRALVLAGTMLLVLGSLLLGMWPFGWLALQSGGGSYAFDHFFSDVSAVRILINTFVPTLITAVVQVLVVYLAALGIGALRPFGERSRWLLLPFSPWLFVTIFPLSVAHFISARNAEVLNRFLGLFSPIRISIPALFILTLFFLGRAARRDEPMGTDDFFQRFILPSLPLTGVLVLFSFFFGSMGLVWPLLAAASQKLHTLGLVLVTLRGALASEAGLASVITLFFVPASLLFFIVLALFQNFYLDRLVLDIAPPSSDDVFPAQNLKVSVSVGLHHDDA